MTESIITRSFAGGELAPALAARADLAQYTTGLRTCRNFIIQRHGGAANRAGTRLITRCATDSSSVKLIRYTSEIDGQSVLIEHGVGYFRFYLAGAQVDVGAAPAYDNGADYTYGDLVSDGGVNYYCIAPTTGHAPPNATYWYAQPDGIYEVPSPFSNPRETKVTQSGRVLSFTHHATRPHDLIFVSLTQWALVPLTTAPKVAAPDNLALSAGSGARKFGYVVTAAHPLTYEESLPSGVIVNAAAADPTDAAPHELTWDAVLTPPLTGDASPEYYVYCDPYGNGTYGYIGTATGAAAFNNPGLTPDFTITPQLPRDLFETSDEYPECSGYHQQRRVIANTTSTPDIVKASRVGYVDNFGLSSPLQDDDALEFRIAGNDNHAVRWLVALKRLLVFTDSGEWAIGEDKQPLTPSALSADQETYVGIARFVPPVVVGNSVVYVQSRRAIVRELRFDQQVEGFNGRDLTVLAAHLFRGHTLRAIDYAQTPDSIVWAVRSDGVLLGLTYLPEENMAAWHRHDTIGGAFEDVCVIPEDTRDAAYVIVRRGSHRYIERLESREIVDWNVDSFFVDSGLSYHGSPVSTVTGLDHLEGQTVRAVGDGRDLGTFVVAAGAIGLSAAYSDIHVGLPITADLETLSIDVAGSAVRDKKKRVGSVTVLLDDSSRAFQVGPDLNHLVRYVPRSTEEPDVASFTGDVEVNTFSRFNSNGRLSLRQSAALPLTVLGVMPNIEVGG
jgi:hypothetical protein